MLPSTLPRTLPRNLCLLLLCLTFSSGMSASLVREKIATEDIPAPEPPAETVVAEITDAGTNGTAEPKVDIPTTEPAGADEFITETVVGSPDADALVVLTHAKIVNMPATKDTANMDLRSIVKETLRTGDMVQVLSAQLEDQEELAEDAEIQHDILMELGDQGALEREVEGPGAKAPARPVLPDDNGQMEDSDWGLASIRESLQTTNGYFDSLVELMGGRNGVCQYVCKYGKTPVHRHGYITAEPNGCASDIIGFQVPDTFDLGIPAMTQCCNQLDRCYDTCGSNKLHCDSKYRLCLHAICSDLKKSLGFVSKVKACESVADAMHSTVSTLGCRSFMNSQREACYCEGEDRDEL
ncbi:hypothetical protein DPEC_G00326310 [Dallia pectoralis]|uniref:Uncharacterized protein n=1 Tax=Dallia pectoralis TaxID=75939 RepID=A0ACC2F7W9_DALPE|nr:hypothetical protein DPEC_G00326310 [Dallia pectoralis]